MRKEWSQLSDKALTHSLTSPLNMNCTILLHWGLSCTLALFTYTEENNWVPTLSHWVILDNEQAFCQLEEAWRATLQRHSLLRCFYMCSQQLCKECNDIKNNTHKFSPDVPFLRGDPPLFTSAGSCDINKPHALIFLHFSRPCRLSSP